MEQSPAMGKLRVLIATLFLVIPVTVCQRTSSTRFQNLYPGCKSSPDQPDMSYPDCDWSGLNKTGHPVIRDGASSAIAMPGCQQHLQVKCLSPNKGFIETPGWSHGSVYPNHMDHCVTLHVPARHVTMISLVSIDVERFKLHGGEYCFDKFQLFRTENCKGKPQIICQVQELPRSVINDTQALSFRFFSDGSVNKTGFRMLYSFHESSQTPLQLQEGSWDCDVPFYASFQQHFACTLETDCYDERDKGECPMDDSCGPHVLTTDGSCYHVVMPEPGTAWTKALETCSSYGGTLANLNGPVELRKASNFTKNIGVDQLFVVGLRRSPLVGLPEIYQNTWQWMDQTLAVYVPLTFDTVTPPYCCAALKGPNLTMVSKKQEQNKVGLLCEFKVAPDYTKTSVSMPIPSSWAMDNMTQCRHNHFAHTFLACDVSTNCSVTNEEEISKCSNLFSPPVPLFTCRNQMGRVPYTLVCDFRPDCCDHSDEDFCQFPDCEWKTQFKCAVGKQCVQSKVVCDKRHDCVDGSDESRCWQLLFSKKLWTNDIEPPARIDFLSHGNFRVTQLPNATCPETHFQCPGGGYCLPVYVRCNEVNDCPGKEDEMNCDHYTCPGFYRCRHSTICLHSQHLCDNIFQCPEHDDEWMCNATCPVNCHCYGHAFTCTGFFTTSDYPELRYADVSGTGMTPDDFLNNTKLIHLSVKNCSISTLGRLSFPNLQSLDVSFNDIQTLHRDQFLDLKNLVSISVAYNRFLSLDSFLNSSLIFSNIVNMNLSGILMPESSKALFNALSNVRYLNLSNTGLTQLGQTGFQSLTKLRMLDLRGCPMTVLHHGIFKGLKRLDLVYADNYRICCPENLPQGMDSTRCHAPSDETSSCDALLKTDVFRVLLTFYAIITLVGNMASFVYRVFIDRRIMDHGYEVFVTHLSVSDFLMGVYLSIVGIADRIYYENYRWHDVDWTESVACKLAGFLSLLSSEVSALLISLITLERVLVIGFPHRNLRFNGLSAHAVSMAAWLLGLLLALVPLLPMTSHWHFYSQSAICAPLPITRKQFDGSDYVFAVLIITNFVLFVFVAVGQLLIYWSVRVNTAGCNDSSRESKDITIARRLLAVVMTDFMCWFPIGLLGIMARCGVAIPSEVIVATSVFMLPINSALNPFLYTLNVVIERRRCVSSTGKSAGQGEMVSSQHTSRVSDAASDSKKQKEDYNAQEAFQLFKQFVEDGLLKPAQIRKEVWEIFEGQ